jgi:hypothetical protein
MKIEIWVHIKVSMGMYEGRSTIWSEARAMAPKLVL